MQIAQQATQPIVIADRRYILSVQPRRTNMMQVIKRVVMVMPETGFEVEPTRPTVIEVTATKKKLNITNRTMVKRFIGIVGKIQRKRMMAKLPMRSHAIEMSLSVRGKWARDINPLESSLKLVLIVL